MFGKSRVSKLLEAGGNNQLYAICELHTKGEAVFGDVVAALQSKKPEMRRNGVRALRWLHSDDPEAVARAEEEAIALLDDPDSSVRAAALGLFDEMTTEGCPAAEKILSRLQPRLPEFVSQVKRGTFELRGAAAGILDSILERYPDRVRELSGIVEDLAVLANSPERDADGQYRPQQDALRLLGRIGELAPELVMPVLPAIFAHLGQFPSEEDFLRHNPQRAAALGAIEQIAHRHPHVVSGAIEPLANLAAAYPQYEWVRRILHAIEQGNST